MPSLLRSVLIAPSVMRPAASGSPAGPAGALVRLAFPVVASAALVTGCAGCSIGSPSSGACIASFILHASSPTHTQVLEDPLAGRPSDFALPHGHDGEPYLQALPPGAIAHDHRSI